MIKSQPKIGYFTKFIKKEGHHEKIILKSTVGNVNDKVSA
jgi:hypothetical protein